MLFGMDVTPLNEISMRFSKRISPMASGNGPSNRLCERSRVCKLKQDANSGHSNSLFMVSLLYDSRKSCKLVAKPISGGKCSNWFDVKSNSSSPTQYWMSANKLLVLFVFMLSCFSAVNPFSRFAARII